MSIKITETYLQTVAKELLLSHVIGGLRDNDDLDIAKYHANATLTFIEEVLKNTSGTKQQKIDLIEKLKLEIPKFHGSHNKQNLIHPPQ